LLAIAPFGETGLALRRATGVLPERLGAMAVMLKPLKTLVFSMIMNV
jgi:hypothetical protein